MEPVRIHGHAGRRVGGELAGARAGDARLARARGSARLERGSAGVHAPAEGEQVGPRRVELLHAAVGRVGDHHVAVARVDRDMAREGGCELAGARAGGTCLAGAHGGAGLERSCAGVDAPAEGKQEVARRVELVDPAVVLVGHVDVPGRLVDGDSLRGRELPRGRPGDTRPAGTRCVADLERRCATDDPNAPRAHEGAEHVELLDPVAVAVHHVQVPGRLVGRDSARGGELTRPGPRRAEEADDALRGRLRLCVPEREHERPCDQERRATRLRNAASHRVILPLCTARSALRATSGCHRNNRPPHHQRGGDYEPLARLSNTNVFESANRSTDRS